LFFEILGVHRDSISQSGSCLGSVRVHSLTLSYTPRSMWCDSRASSWLATLQPLCFGRKPKAKVATRCVVLVVRSIVFTFVWMTLDFIMSLKNIFCKFKSQPKRMQMPPKLIYHILQLQVDVGCNRTLSKLSSVNKKYYSHLVVANIGDKQVQWRLVLHSTFMCCTTMQM